MKVHTVKSNARREARKLGLDPALVVAVEGGFTIPGEPAAMEPPTPASPPRGKIAAVLDALKEGWVSTSALMTATGWQAHTIRGALSTVAKKQGLKIERERVDGVTSYRVAQ